MARRGLQALHEICAGDPEGVAVNLLDAHLRNSTEPVTVDDVSEQMSLLGISDKSLAWIGARAALWRRADWARYRTAEGHLYYLRDDGVSQWEHPLQNELRQLYDAARHSPLARPPPRGGYDAQFASSRRSSASSPTAGRRPRVESPGGTLVDSDETPGWTRTTGALGGQTARRRAACAADGLVTDAASAASSASSSPRGHPEQKSAPRADTFDTGPTSPLTAESGNADLAANFANMQGKLEALQARMLEPTLVEDERRAANAAFAAASSEAQRLRAALDAAEAARDRAEGDLKAVRAHAAAQQSREARERAAAADRATEKIDAARNAAVAADAAEKIARRDANALAAQKADVARAAAAAHAAAAFLSGSRFRALLKANEQLRGALATQEAQRAAAAKRVDVQKRADASTRDALETATKRIIAEKSRVAEEALEAMHDARAALGAERVAKDARAVVAEAWLADALVAWDADAAENAAARAALAARVEELVALNAKAESRLENVKRDRDYFRSKVAVAARAEEPPAPPPEERRMGRGAGGGPRPPPGPPPATPPPADGESPVLVV
ncbi:unnamed protein product [Pelagomonas calceolata]|uniref:WW domain-containing protein n=2 Tax=Pelagomonas calceolata TaxID=35677 RepID=A0A8J2WS12_9STRA|nr:unnamed protein product [Pelagomonas calceolata]